MWDILHGIHADVNGRGVAALVVEAMGFPMPLETAKAIQERIRTYLGPEPDSAPMPGAACGAGAGADDCEYICTEPRGHDGVHKQVRKDGACTILDAAWSQDTPSSSHGEFTWDDRLIATRWYEANYDTLQGRRTTMALAALLADVRRETIEECAKWVSDNCGTMNGNTMARHFRALATEKGGKA